MADSRLMSAAELLEMDFGPERWAVPAILPEGVTIFAGKAKIGKSWMALGIGLAVASGGLALGKIPVEQGDVLYLALEDNKRRLHKRLTKLLQGAPVPDGLDVAVEWPKVGGGLEEELANWAVSRQGSARLVIIDTLKRIRPHAPGNRNVYDVDYDALAPLLPVAAEYGVSILVIHHLRQLPADDPMDQISGSTGLTAVVDNALILRRDRGEADAYLYVTGRDIEEDREYALAWDGQSASWSVEGDAADYRRSPEQRKILDLLGRADAPMGPKEVAEATGLPHGSVRVLMPKMEREGLLDSPTYGTYRLATPAHSSVAHDKRRSQQSATPSEQSAGDEEATPDSLADKRPTEEGDPENDVVPEAIAPDPLTTSINSLNTTSRSNSVNSSAKESVNGVSDPLGGGEAVNEPSSRWSLGTVNAVNGDGQNSRRLTEEEVGQVKRLIHDGMSPAAARAEELVEGEEG